MKKQIFILATLLMLLSACNSQGQEPPFAEPTTQVQTPDIPATVSPTAPSDTGLESTPAVSSIRLDQPFEKAVFQEGPFDFEFYLYQDSGFSTNPAMTWMYSDLPGVGIHTSWKFHGTDLNDQVTESWGTCPDINPGNVYPALRDGDNGIREGGILLPQNIAAGSQGQFVLKLETSQGTYGGILSFVLIQGTQGLEPSQVTVYGFDQALQAGGCIADLQSSFMPQSTSTPAAPAAIIVPKASPFPSGLSVEEHELGNAPQVEPLVFTPLQGSQENVLRAHQQERAKRFPDNTFDNPLYHALWVDWRNGKMIAREVWDQANNRMAVDVLFGKETYFSIDLGTPSPITSLQGLWTYNDHWVLEVVRVTQNQSQDGGLESVSVGQVILDGTSLNEKYGYAETFGFQLMRGKPFYFFHEGDRIGFSYDGQEVMLGYTHISHHECCSGADLNPVSAENMVAFFAERDGKWYYVEIGVYE